MARENEIRVKRPPASQHEELKSIAAKLEKSVGEVVKTHLQDIINKYPADYRTFKKNR